MTIIALLVAILLPALGGACAQAQSVVCKSRLHQTDLTLLMYAENNEGWTPYNYDSITPTYHTWAGTLDASGYLNELDVDRDTVMMCPSQEPYRFADETMLWWREIFVFGMRTLWSHASFNLT